MSWEEEVTTIQLKAQQMEQMEQMEDEVSTADDVRNEDWTKTNTWDIWLGNALVKTLPQLREFLTRQRIDVDHFLSLPAAEAMPEGLKVEVGLWRQERVLGGITGEGKGEGEGKALFRRVRTAEGVREFHAPIGTPIRPHVVPNTPHAPDPHAPSSTHDTDSPHPGLANAGHYGTMTLDDYLDGLDAGKFPSWTKAYRASWVGGEGQIDPVADHDAIPGGREGAFVDGKVRVAIANYGDTGNTTVNFQIRGKANVRQRGVMAKLMEETSARRSIVSVMGNDRGEGEPINGEFTFDTPDQLRAFLTDPTKRPEKNERAAVLAQFKEDEEGEEKEEGEGEGEDKSAVRHVRTPAGVEKYNAPIGTPIRPHVPHTEPHGGHGGVVGALSHVMDRIDRGKAPKTPEAPKGIAGKPTALLNARESRLLTDPAYAKDFEAKLSFIKRRLPEMYDDFDPTHRNPQYAAYVDDLSRRLAHAMVEPGPLGFDPDSESYTKEGRTIINRIVRQQIAIAEENNIPRDRHMIAAAGVSGAGKTTTLQKLSDKFGIRFNRDENGNPKGAPLNFVVPNPDDLKEKMEGDLPPEYGALGINPNESALLTHELSSGANKALLKAYSKNGFNMVLDATFEGPMNKRVAEADDFRNAGYQVDGVLVDGRIRTSIERAAGRHIVIQGLLPKGPDGRADFSKGDMSVPGMIDGLGMPVGGYGGRFVPVGLIGDQLPDGRPVLDTAGWQWVNDQVAQSGIPAKRWGKAEYQDLLRRAPGARVEHPDWAPDDTFLSANAMNFQNAINDGMFGKWTVVDSVQKVVAEGGTGGVVHLLAKMMGRADGMEGKAAAPGTSPAREWMEGPDDDYPILGAISAWDEGTLTWEDVKRLVAEYDFLPTRQPGQMMWAETEDAFPQPGTTEEIVAAMVAGVLSEEEADELDGVAKVTKVEG